MRYHTLLFDLDDTLIDFHGSERSVLEKAFSLNHLPFGDETFEIYRLINRELWQNFEKGLYTKNEILTLRFDLLFVQIGLYGDAAQLNHDFLVSMGDFIIHEDQALEILGALKGKVRMAMITNGAKLAQDIKLEKSGLAPYFEAIYISDEVGFHKPDPAFFNHVLEDMNLLDKKEGILVVGDGLGSDIIGGNLAGLDTCWYNRRGLTNLSKAEPTYEIKHLNELLKIY